MCQSQGQVTAVRGRACSCECACRHTSAHQHVSHGRGDPPMARVPLRTQTQRIGETPNPAASSAKRRVSSTALLPLLGGLPSAPLFLPSVPGHACPWAALAHAPLTPASRSPCTPPCTPALPSPATCCLLLPSFQSAMHGEWWSQSRLAVSPESQVPVSSSAVHWHGTPRPSSTCSEFRVTPTGAASFLEVSDTMSRSPQSPFPAS